ncbi:DUF1097 domain-containing protein [Microbulbifer taiwanensis]|uniref:DUF1097 domain-containing protein n=1 Tax=Microbulbifer taiwanensis TaxID=986746 RepID=A0ABW1YHP8_9GAMM|nr:DUF1097 domain-containing protein [Microbulbifer taiwanensis]
MGQAVTSEHRAEFTAEPRAVSRLSFTPLSAALIAGAAALCLLADLPVWVALAGWASYYTRGTTLRDGAYNLACAVTGLGLGIVAQAAAAKWSPELGIWALPAALFLAAISIQMLKFITGVNNIPSYFIGVLVVFAAGMETSLDTYLTLTAAVSVGAFAAALPDIIRQRREPEVE